MLTIVFEAAFRSLLLALAVWAGIRLLRVRAVVAEKVAWVLVLLAAAAMPLAMRAPWPGMRRAFEIPLRSFSAGALMGNGPLLGAAVEAALPLEARVAVDRAAGRELLRIAKPAAGKASGSTVKARAGRGSLAAGERRAEAVDAGLVDSHPVAADGVIAPVLASAPVPALAVTVGETGWAWVRGHGSRLVLLGYLAVVAVLMVRMAAGLWIAFGIWRRAEAVEIPAEAMPSLHGRVLRARRSEELATPVTLGSTILLPGDYERWDLAKLRIVLAHEQSHVRQGDFYLQLAAGVYAVAFWFSPLGWWLERKLSELGEALSDRAGLEQAASRSTYAQVLLEFAALPYANQRGKTGLVPFAGVPMARTSHVASRIERILNDHRFRMAFAGGGRKAVLVATLVPAVLIAAATLVRIVPVVEAKAGAGQAGSGQASGQAGSVGSGTAGAASGQASDSVAGQVSTADSDVDTGRMAPVAPVGPVSPVGPDAIVVAPEPPTAIGPIAPVAPVAPVPPVGKHGSSYTYSTSDDGDAYAIVQDGGNTTMMMNGRHNNDFEKVRKQYPGKFIWYEHDGKSYVITDPKILADSQSLFQANRPLQLRQEELNRMQQKLNREMADLKPEIDRASIPGPEFREQMAKLNAQLAELQSDKFKKLSDQIAREVADNQKLSQKEIQELTQEKLGELQEKIGDIQGRIGEIQGKIGEKQGELGEKQGEIGERMGKLGEEMGRIGEEEGRIAEEASRKMKLMLDQAVRDGKAKPVD